MNFSELITNDKILRALTDLGFETPTSIQEIAIPAVLENDQDIVALAQTGTGKTAAFGIPVIEKTDPSKNYPQSLVLCPTRELGMQVAQDLQNLAKYCDKLNIVCVYGGASISDQIRLLKKGAQIIVGTPGRTMDLINRNALDISKISTVVLDEADEMLNMGFKEEVDGILAFSPAEKRVLLFSATMPAEVRKIAKTYMQNALEIKGAKGSQAPSKITHHYYVVRSSDRYEAIKRLADESPEMYGIVFCRTRQETKDIADKLMQEGYNADALHGDLSQSQRDAVMKKFRNKNLQLLIATDVAARGIDVDELTHVINYKLPDDPEVYVHRSGRTGRAGNSGKSMVIVTQKEVRNLKSIEKSIGQKFQQGTVPDAKAIGKNRLLHWAKNLQAIEVNEEEVNPYVDDILALYADISKEEMVKKMIAKELALFFSYYKNDLNINVSSDDTDFEDRRSKKVGFTEFYVNLGSKMGLNVVKLIGIINERLRKRNVEIGRIDIQRNFSFFEIDSRFVLDTKKAFEDFEYQGVKVALESSSKNRHRAPVAREKKPDRHNAGRRRKSRNRFM